MTDEGERNGQGKALCDTRDWPASLRAVADVIGPELALELARKAGGIDTVYVPRRPSVSPVHPWARAIGQEPFVRLCAVLGGTRVDLPRGVAVVNRKARIIELAEEGVSRRETALRLGVTIRHVRRTLQGLGLDSLHGPAARAASARAGGTGPR